MAELLEQTLLKLLMPDSNIITQATQELKHIVKQPEVVPALCQLLASSQNHAVRQYAAVLLRRKILKKKQWNDLSPEISQNIRHNILIVLLKEPEKIVQKSLAQLVATIAKHDLVESKWPELFQFLEQYIKSAESSQREVGMFLLSSITSAAHEELKPHQETLIQLCLSSLTDNQNYMVPYYSIQTLLHILRSIDSKNKQILQNLFPMIYELIGNLIQIDQELASESMNLLDDLVEHEVPIIVPHLKSCLLFCNEIAKNKDLESQLRVKALSIICTIISKRKKVVIKMNLIPSLVSELFEILCEETPEEEKDDEEEDEGEGSSASAFASQVFDIMALNFPPEKYIPPLLKQIEPAFNSSEARVRRAAFLAIAVSTEGCSENIKNKHMKKLLKSIFKGMTDSNNEVRNAAMFALGEFSEYLQPDISKHSQELLPLLFQCLNKSSNGTDVRRKDLVRTYYAMEKFCENLGKDILPYLPQLMEFLLNSIKTGKSVEIIELSISAIGSIATSAGEDLLPFLPEILNLLKGFLIPTEEEEALKVQTKAVETLGMLTRNLGEHFLQLASECLLLGLKLANEASDPDLRTSIYSLFGACSTVLKQEMVSHLPTIVKMLTDCLKSTEGITAHFDDDDTEHVSEIFEDGSDVSENIDISDIGEEKEEASSHLASLDLQNSYMDEKIEALTALGEISRNTGSGFLIYINETFKEVTELMEYPDMDIRRAAIICVGQLCCATSLLIKENPELESSLGSALLTMLNSTMVRLVELAREVEDRDVAISVFESLGDIISTVGQPALKVLESNNVLYKLLKDTIKRKLKCQDADEEDLDEEESEYDTLLSDTAGDLIPILAKLVPNNEFVSFFSTILPDLIKKLKKSGTVADRSFALGTMAETMHELKEGCPVFAAKLYPLFMTGARDEDEEVRNNAIYGIGVLCANGGPVILNHYSEVLKFLSDTMAKETDDRVKDNICGAVCRMIITNQNSVPICQVLPAIINHLPLKEDQEEHKTVFECMSLLYMQRNPDLLNALPQLLITIAHLLKTKVKPELKKLLCDFVLDASKNFTDIFNGLQQTSPDVIELLKNCIDAPIS